MKRLLAVFRNLLIGAAACFIMAGSAGATNIVFNPTFNGITVFEGGSGGGWTFINDAGSYPTSGSQGGYVNGVGNGNFGTIQQLLSTTPGTQYDVDFFLTSNQVSPNGNFTVSLGNVVGFSASTGQLTNGGQYSFNATATQLNTLFSFSGTDISGTTWIDKVSVTPLTSATPEPATWAMFLAGFGAVGFMIRSSPRNGRCALLRT
jgi:hypothetical protein